MFQKLLVSLIILGLAACTGASTQTAPPQPTQELVPTHPPTDTPLPTDTAVPTATATPEPTATATLMPTITPTEGPTPTPYVCTDSLGCVSLPPGAPVKIGYLLDQSGPVQAIGMDVFKALQLAVEMLGPLHEHPLELVGYDSQCDSKVGRAAADQLLAEPDVVGVIGTVCSGAAISAMPPLSRKGWVMISPTNSNPMLTSPRGNQHHPGYLRASYNEVAHGQAAARYAIQELGASTAIALSLAGDPGQREISQRFAETFEELGGQVIEERQVPPGQVDSTVRRLESKVPQVVFLSLPWDIASELLQKARGVPALEGVTFIGDENLFNPGFINQSGAAAEGVLAARASLENQGEKFASQFMPAFKEAYGEPQSPPGFLAMTYDAALLLFNALQQAAVVYPDGSLYIPRQALREALYATQGLEGLSGTLSCSPEGDCAGMPIAIYRFQEGVFPPDPIWP